MFIKTYKIYVLIIHILFREINLKYLPNVIYLSFSIKFTFALCVCRSTIFVSPFILLYHFSYCNFIGITHLKHLKCVYKHYFTFDNCFTHSNLVEFYYMK